MPVGYPLNDANEVSGDLGNLADQRTEEQLRKDLEKGSKQARRAIGGNGILTERLYKNREKQVKWELTFPGVAEFERLVLDDEEISDSKYTVSKGVVEVTDSDLIEDLEERDDYVLRAEYVPELLKELELDYAEKRIARNSSITTNDETSSSRLEDIQRDIDNKVEKINRLACSMADPSKGDHAKNQDRNSIIL